MTISTYFHFNGLATFCESVLFLSKNLQRTPENLEFSIILCTFECIAVIWTTCSTCKTLKSQQAYCSWHMLQKQTEQFHSQVKLIPAEIAKLKEEIVNGTGMVKL